MTDTTEATGSGWVSRWLNPGDIFHNEPLTATQGGIELFDGTVIVDNVKGLAELGHALVNRYDPPTAATTVAGTVHIAYADTGHWKWLGLGATAEQARAALMTAWYAHAETVGADPEYLRDDEITITAGAIGTGFRDFDAFPRP